MTEPQTPTPTWPARTSPFGEPPASPTAPAADTAPVRLRSPLDIPTDEEIGVTTSTEANW